jgi:hypothetical protein
MDPTATLTIMRELVKQIETIKIEESSLIQICDLALDLAEHVDALDRWMTRSGSFPAQWARKL